MGQLVLRSHINKSRRHITVWRSSREERSALYPTEWHDTDEVWAHYGPRYTYNDAAIIRRIRAFLKHHPRSLASEVTDELMKEWPMFLDPRDSVPDDDEYHTREKLHLRIITHMNSISACGAMVKEIATAEDRRRHRYSLA